MTLRAALGRIAGSALRALAKALGPPRVILDRDGSSPYLSRTYVVGRALTGFDEQGNPAERAAWSRGILGVHVYIHRFHRSDQDLALHNHPWKWALSFVVSGGYEEERRVGKTCVPCGGRRGYDLDCPLCQGVGNSFEVVRRTVGPLSCNWIDHDTFHRVDLLEKDAWSVFVAGPRVTEWSFWDRDTHEETPWREFLARTRAS